MKKIKVSFLAFTVFAMAIVVSAFTTNSIMKKDTYYWFSYVSGSKTVAASYNNPNVNPPSCSSTVNICAILARNDGHGHPMQTDLDAINTAGGLSAPSASSKFKP